MKRKFLKIVYTLRVAIELIVLTKVGLYFLHYLSNIGQGWHNANFDQFNQGIFGAMTLVGCIGGIYRTIAMVPFGFHSVEKIFATDNHIFGYKWTKGALFGIFTTCLIFAVSMTHLENFGLIQEWFELRASFGAMVQGLAVSVVLIFAALLRLVSFVQIMDEISN